ncbi:MAG: HEAT repeat domain-containing protein [Holophaga sp.]|nr:HEAT repeat domain-containing protein [Holophaga sp.]
MPSHSLDPLRTLLDHLEGDERADQLAFFQGLLEVGPAAIEELDGRLPGSRAPKALRRLALEASFYYPWPGWVPILHRLLRYESDHEIFVTGVRALGRIGSPEALEALRDLNGMRQGAEFTETLAEVLSETDPQEAFNHYFSQLMEGSANTRAANEAAQRLVHLVDGTRIEALQTLIQHPDLLVFRSALMLLAHVFTPEAAQALQAIFLENHREVLADRRLKEALAALRNLPPAAAFEAAGTALEALDPEADPGGLLGEFYQDVQGATREGKVSQLSTLLGQVADAMHLRSRRLGFALDTTAEGLAEMAVRGLVGTPAVLDLLVPAYREQTGREGLARALARLAPAGAEEIHQLILAGPDGAQRAAAVEVLGARADPALQPVLLRACRDPLTDIADRARFFLGALPGAEDLAQALLHAPGPADFQLGLRLVAERRFAGLVPDLLALLKDAAREELSLQLVEALGAVGSVQVLEPLLELFHSGQSPRLQTALALALRDTALPQAATALCAKAAELKNTTFRVIAVEALAAAPGPLAPEAGPMLLDQVRGAWNDRNPWPLRLRLVLALQAIDLPAPEVWLELAGLVNDALQEKRSPSAWSPEELHQVQAAARDLAKRAS